MKLISHEIAHYCNISLIGIPSMKLIKLSISVNSEKWWLISSVSRMVVSTRVLKTTALNELYANSTVMLSNVVSTTAVKKSPFL